MPHILRRIALGVLAACALLATGVQPAVAVSLDHPRAHVVNVHLSATKKSKQGKQDALCKKATRLRKVVTRKEGTRAPGRDICLYGMTGGKRPTREQKLNYTHTLHRIAYPPKVVVVTPAPSAPPPTAAASQSPGIPAPSSGSSLPGCASESGTDYSTGPDNTNPSTGATGRYQEMPMHRQPGGLCYGIDLSPAGQDRCAGIIYGAQGSGAWVGCG